MNSAGVYPGTCRNGLPAGKTPRALRMRTTAEPICFVDRVQGDIEQSVERDVGDFIVCRADGQFAYQLAVVVDDAEQGITDVVRGADLLDSTARQIYLQRLLGYSTPHYLHVPVAVNAVGEKLSKQTGAPPIELTSAKDQLRRALAFLGQPKAANLREAVRNWDPGCIPARRMVIAPDAPE
jgi:glutamyl-Q tRNA(Asp) synthetase